MFRWRTATTATWIRNPNSEYTIQPGISKYIAISRELEPSYLPEKLNDFIIFGIASVVGMLLPVIDIDIGDTANQ